MKPALRTLDDGLWLHLGVEAGRPARQRILREHLGQMVGCAPGDLVIEVSAQGWPRLVWPTDQLFFSVAHRGANLLIATAWDRPVGADLEIVASTPSDLGLARHFFAPAEAAWLAGLDPETRGDGFFRLWTAKEAVLKALGFGIEEGMHEPDLSGRLLPGQALTVSDVATKAGGRGFTVRWWFLRLTAGLLIAADAKARA